MTFLSLYLSERPVSRRAEQQVGIAPPLVLGRAEEHGLVAAELQILRTSAHGEPDEGVEPAHGYDADEAELRARVVVADVDYLVPQDEPQLILGIRPIRQDYPQRAPEHAYAQRRRHGPGAQEQRPASPELCQLQLLDEQRLGLRLRLYGPAQYAAAEDKVLGYLVEQQETAAREPYAEQRKRPIAGSHDDKQRHTGSKSLDLDDVQHIRQQPERDAGPAADALPQPGHEQREDGVVDAQQQKGVEAQRQKLAHRVVSAEKRPVQQREEQEKKRDAAGVGIGPVDPAASAVPLLAVALHAHGNGRAHDDGKERREREAREKPVVHSSPPSSRARNSSSSSRLSPLSQSAAAKTDRLPPQSLSRKLRLCPARYSFRLTSAV